MGILLNLQIANAADILALHGAYAFLMVIAICYLEPEGFIAVFMLSGVFLIIAHGILEICNLKEAVYQWLLIAWPVAMFLYFLLSTLLGSSPKEKKTVS